MLFVLLLYAPSQQLCSWGGGGGGGNICYSTYWKQIISMDIFCESGLRHLI